MVDLLSHLVIHVDDLDRASSFYERAFGWRSVRWGNGEIRSIESRSSLDPSVQIWLRRRSGDSIATDALRGVEFVVTVQDLEDAIRGIREAGGALGDEQESVDGDIFALSATDPFGNRFLVLRKR